MFAKENPCKPYFVKKVGGKGKQTTGHETFRFKKP